MTHWVRFRREDGHVGFGMLEGHGIVEHAGNMFDNPMPTGTTLSPSQVEFIAPCMPSKVVALWNNFHELSAKLDKKAPLHPLFLIKPASSVIGPAEPIRRPQAYRGRIAFEGELAIVIGRLCKDVSVNDAPAHIFGYTCINDVTAIDLLNEDPNFAQWCRSKGYDTFACIGPVIATDVDVANARVVTRLDAVERQNYPLSDMIFSPAEQVSRISHDMSLVPGDIIACGTSVGVGSIKDGSTVEIAIDGVGSLVNTLAPPGANAS